MLLYYIMGTMDDFKPFQLAMDSGFYVLNDTLESEYLLSLHKIHSSRSHDDLTVNVLRWKEDDLGLSATWSSRGDLQGHEFKAVIDHWSPFVYNITPLASDRFTALGLNIAVLRELEHLMNFTTHLIKGNGSWSSMVQQVSNHSLDFAAAGFSHTYKRRALVDFSMPLTTTFLRMFYARENEDVFWLLYFKSYQVDSWMGIIVSFILSFAIFATLIMYSKKYLGEDFTKFSTLMAFCFTALSQVSL